jgi:hypothetical protein
MQTTYSTDPAVGYAGLEVDTEPSRKLHAINEEVAAIPFGVALVRGTDGDKAKLPAAAGDALKLLGIALSTYWQDNRSLSGSAGVAAGDVCTVIEEGAVWALPEQDVVKGDPVFMRITANGGNTQLGALRKDVDSGNAVRLRNAYWDSVATAGSPAKVRLRAPLGGSDEGFMWSAVHAQVTATTTVPLFQNRSDRHLLIKGLKYYNATGLAQDATNFFAITVENAAGNKVFGTWSTETGEEGSVGAGEYEALTLGANLVVAPGEAVELVLTEGGTATLPAGTIFLEGEYL